MSGSLPGFARHRGRAPIATVTTAVGSLAVGLLVAAAPALQAQAAVGVAAYRPGDSLGPNVHVFSPTMNPDAIQAQINSAYAVQERNEFGARRDAFLFKPGVYSSSL
ncbi:MAG: hypothetical protein ACRC0L_07440, partial [Angustibacter sp.]